MNEFTKEQIINASITWIEETAKQEGMTVINKGTGHAFENTALENIVEDTSEIPNVIAENDKCRIKLRSFWGNPEIDIDRHFEGLLVLTFSDTRRVNGNYIKTGMYHVSQVRVDCCADYKKAVQELYDLIDRIEEIIKHK